MYVLWKMPEFLPTQRSVVNPDRVFKHYSAIDAANQRCNFGQVLLLNIPGVSQTVGGQ